MSTNAFVRGETTSLHAGNESCALAICRIYTREMNVGPGDGRWIPQGIRPAIALFKGHKELKEVESLWNSNTCQHTKQCCGAVKILNVDQQERKKKE
jgi:hypothetical protein